MDLFQDVTTPVEHNLTLNLSLNLDNGTGDAAMSPESSSSKSKLQLPVSCDPPGPGNPAKQMVWIVSSSLLCYSRWAVEEAFS